MSELPRTQALRCFITVAREGTVSRAASILRLTQPAVSLQLKALEESTGLQLFNRTPGGFTLTEAGAALLPLAHKAVAAAQDFGTTAASLKDTQRRTLRVGTVLDPEFIRLGAFVRSLTRGSSIRRTTSGEPSVDASSTTMTSKSCQVCRSTLRMLASP